MRSFWLLPLLLTVACGGGGASYSPAPSPTPSPTPVTVTAQDIQHCVDKVNGYRASVGKRALARSAALDSQAAAAAEHDALVGIAHDYYRKLGGGLATAENECGALLSETGTVARATDFCMDALWAEGPSGGHYQNIVGPYSQLGCGIYILNGSEVHVTTDFR